MAAGGPTAEREAIIGEEVRALYTNGPGGGGGARRYVHEHIGIVSTLMYREQVRGTVTVREWAPHAETV